SIPALSRFSSIRASKAVSATPRDMSGLTLGDGSRRNKLVRRLRSLSFAHAFGGLRRAALAHLLLNASADIRVHALPIVECAAQHRLADAAEQAASDGLHQLCTLFVVEDVADQNS